MFKIKGEALQQVVGSLTKGAKRARLGESRVFVSSTSETEVLFYFVGEELQVQKRMECEVVKPFSFTTNVSEIEVKVGALPDDELITIEQEGERLYLKWGRSSKISMETIPETSPAIEIPTPADSVIWTPGKLHILARSLPAFSAVTNSENAKKNPVLRGLYFSKEETGEVIVRATNAARAVTVNAQGIDWFDGFYPSIPTETMLSLAELLPIDVELTVSVNEEHSLLVFTAGNTTAVSRIIVGDFPPIDKSYTLPEESNSTWIVDRTELLNTARRIKRLGGDRPIMVFKKEGSKAMVELQGILIEQIGATIEGDGFEFAIHSDYLELCLSLYRTEEVFLCMKEKNSPITVVCDENKDTKALIAPYVVK